MTISQSKYLFNFNSQVMEKFMRHWNDSNNWLRLFLQICVVSHNMQMIMEICRLQYFKGCTSYMMGMQSTVFVFHMIQQILALCFSSYVFYGFCWMKMNIFLPLTAVERMLFSIMHLLFIMVFLFVRDSSKWCYCNG